MNTEYLKMKHKYDNESFINSLTSFEKRDV